LWRGANFVQKVGCRCGAVAILDRYVVLRCGEAPESCQQPERSDAVASRKASSSASSSSASSGSDSESEQKPLDVLRDSSSESDMEPAPASARGRCGLIAWSCPRQFPSTVEERRAANLLLPEDMGKEAFGQAILACLKRTALLEICNTWWWCKNITRNSCLQKIAKGAVHHNVQSALQ
jgi:hypothetical protein